MVEEAVRDRGFEIIEQIGAGGFGVVYRAHQPSVGRDVAIKVILPHIARDPLFVKRFEKEARLAAQLEHPNIVPLHDYWRDEERAYLVMRWVRGGTLKESLAKGPWEPAEVVRLVDQIAGALEAAHRQRVIHRDLKPSNIMLDEMGNAYLVDFGIAKHLVGTTIGTPTGAIIGSPAYMAPEQIRGDEITAQSDLYSLGGLIYEILTREPPFGLDDPAILLYRQLHEPLPLICDSCPDLPPAVDTVLQKATAKDPADRYASATDLAEAFAVAISRPELITAGPFLETQVVDIPHNLPVQSTPFVGREDELADLERLLGDPDIRLLTIVGPGGMGKTRLALATAERQLDIHPELSKNGGQRYPNGVFFVPLDALDTPEQIVPEIARSLGLRLVSPGESSGGMGGPERTPEEQLLDFLSTKQLLLVVDNFEHLLEGAGLMAEIRKRAPETQILLTSREKLGLHGEQLYQLKGMRVPLNDVDVASADQLLADYSSSRLFLQSAGRNTPDFALKPGDTRDLTQICQLVDGMPLALELAAGWVDMLSLNDIAAEIREGMDILETHTLDIPDRHRSVEAIFEGTWNRLSQDEQALFKQLSVFRGGFTRQAAREITGATLRQLAGLLNESLLLFDRQANRYHIHRLLRNYGLERLAEDLVKEKTVRDSHCAYYCGAMERWGEAYKGAGQQQALIEMEADSQNILAAWEWAVYEYHLDHLEVSVGAMLLYCERSGRVSQWGEVCTLAADRLEGLCSPDANRVLAQLFSRQGWFLGSDEDLELVGSAIELITELGNAGHNVEAEKAYALWRMGGLKRWLRGDVELGYQLLSQSEDIYRSIDDLWGMANVLETEGQFRFRQGDLNRAEELFEKSIRKRHQMDDNIGELASLQNLADVYDIKGNHEKAITIQEQVTAGYRKIGDKLGLAGALFAYGMTLFWSGKYSEARSILLESDEILDDFGLGYHGMPAALCEVHSGDYDAANKYRHYDGHDGESFDVSNFGRMWLLGRAATARQEFFEASEYFEEAISICRKFRRVLPLGFCLAWQSIALHGRGLHGEATSLLREALQATIRTKAQASLADVLPTAALILAGNGESLRAVEIYELALTFPYVANARLFEDVIGKHIIAIAESLPPEVVDAARQRGRERDPWATAAELLAELEAEESPD